MDLRPLGTGDTRPGSSPWVREFVGIRREERRKERRKRRRRKREKRRDRGEREGVWGRVKIEGRSVSKKKEETSCCRNSDLVGGMF